jgi:hypothetical protein
MEKILTTETNLPQKTLGSLLQEVRHHFQGLSSGDLRPSMVEYTREGNSFSVRIVSPASLESEDSSESDRSQK